MDILLLIVRTYYAAGTNGELTINGLPICFTIELPWKDNKRKVSCIPEGRYGLSAYRSPKHGWVLLVGDVPNRAMVEFHEANYALGADGKSPQLEGCLAPVTRLEPGRPGVGWRSGDACNKLEGLVFPVLRAGGAAWLTIRAKNEVNTLAGVTGRIAL